MNGRMFMKAAGLVFCGAALAMLAGCSCSESEPMAKGDLVRPSDGHAEILQSWHGDYPVTQLDRLTPGQRERATGFIDDPEVFAGIWKAFRPNEVAPEIDFEANLVIFARNTQFYNRISIGQVKVTDGVAEILAMETMSAAPIEDKVAISLAVVARQGITAIQAGDESVRIDRRR